MPQWFDDHDRSAMERWGDALVILVLGCTLALLGALVAALFVVVVVESFLR